MRLIMKFDVVGVQRVPDGVADLAFGEGSLRGDVEGSLDGGRACLC